MLSSTLIEAETLDDDIFLKLLDIFSENISKLIRLFHHLHLLCGPNLILPAKIRGFKISFATN